MLDSELVKAEFAQHAKEQEAHLDLLTGRVTQLGRKPNLDPEGLLARAASEHVEGKNLGRHDQGGSRRGTNRHRELPGMVRSWRKRKSIPMTCTTSSWTGRVSDVRWYG
jgi:hypothetical protein